MAKATLTISSKNYSSWSLRGWLLARFAGLDFRERMVAPDDADSRKELLLLSPSILVPCLTHDGVKVWDTLAIGEYLNELKPRSGLLPADRAARAHCRAVCGEMHSGFSSLRSALPMNLKGILSRPQGMGAGQGRHRAHRGDLARVSDRLWRPFSLRQEAQHGRCHVRAGSDALHHLRRRSSTRSAPPIASASWPCPRWSNGSRRRSASRRKSTSSTWSSDRRIPATGHFAFFHFFGAGMAHGAGMSMVLKSAGPTISRYSMSGE